MDWLRSAIGISAPAPAPVVASKKSAVPHEERAEKFARAQALRIRMLQAELKDTESETQRAVDAGDRAGAKRHLLRTRQLRAELTTLQQKHDNMTQTRNAISTANSNLAQGKLVKEGADELEAAVAAMEEIKLDEAIDKLQDNAAMVREHDSRLSEPIFGDTNYEEEDIDDEMDRLMQQKQEEKAAAASAKLPDIPSTLPDPKKAPPQPQVEGIESSKEPESLLEEK